MQKVELLIVGGGVAGLSAGLYAARSRLDVLLLERLGAGGQLINVDRVENYPGFPAGIAGYELGPLITQQALDAGLRITYGEALSLEAGNAGEPYLVRAEGAEFQAPAIVLACGSTLARLGVPGETEFEGRGVSYCATCDGDFCRDQPVVVVGGGDSALDEARYLTEIAASVTIVHRRDAFRAERIAHERIGAATYSRVRWCTEVVAIVGDDTVTGVRLRSQDGAEELLPTAGVFIYVGLSPNTAWLRDALELDGGGHVKTDGRLQASLPGVFAAGDLRQHSVRQLAASTGDGVTAAIWAERYLRGAASR